MDTLTLTLDDITRRATVDYNINGVCKIVRTDDDTAMYPMDARDAFALAVDRLCKAIA